MEVASQSLGKRKERWWILVSDLVRKLITWTPQRPTAKCKDLKTMEVEVGPTIN
jgi:hypothetical protein